MKHTHALRLLALVVAVPACVGRVAADLDASAPCVLADCDAVAPGDTDTVAGDLDPSDPGPADALPSDADASDAEAADAGPGDADVTDVTPSDLDTVEPECHADAECGPAHPEIGLSACETWGCVDGACEVGWRPDGAACVLDAEPALCDAGACTALCGDGLVQSSLGEGCDDANLFSGDGCRVDCVLEETIGAGFLGGQCLETDDCSPAGALCLDDVEGGACALGCTTVCPDQAGSPVTFCIPAAIYAGRLGAALPSELDEGVCVAKCDFAFFPSTGCRRGLHCELRERYNSTVRDEVCVPGPWTVGLAFDTIAPELPVVGVAA